MKLEIPDSVNLSDGSSAIVKRINAIIVDGKPGQIVYTVETLSGAWIDIASEDVAPNAVAMIPNQS